MVAIATVLPLAEKAARPGKNVAGASGLALPVATSTSSVAPAWSWKAMSFASGDHAGMICALWLGARALSAEVSLLATSCR